MGSIKNNSENYILNYVPENHTQIVADARSLIKDYNFCIIKNFNNFDIQEKIYNFMEKRLSESADIRVSGGFHYNMSDYCRLDIGDSYKNMRFSRYILFCEWNEPNKELFDEIQPLLSFRNAISDIKQDAEYRYDIGDNNLGSEACYCDVIRMIQYPVGGGFLSAHNDFDETFYPGEMINVLLPITTRIKPNSKTNNRLQKFEKGGFYYFCNGNKIDVEEIVDSGDLIIHNQHIDHGVNSIDPDKNLDMNTLCGRVTLNFSIGKFNQET